jgi:Cu-Zn family superoxide dismutase
MSWKRFTAGVLGGCLSFVVLSCSQGEVPEHDRDADHEAAQFTRAVAVLHGTEGNTVRGTVTFTAVGNGMNVLAEIEGLTPGDHGFHIHQLGDCSAPDGTSAGGHFNPHGMEHGAPSGEARHTGDFGNVTADESGTARYERVDSEISFSGENSVIGRAVILHAAPDDLVSQPTGAAGARVACGVIGIGG